MTGGGPFGLKPGQWTDDTSMALCLAESLVERGGFDPGDQMKRYVRWWREGHMSCTGRCFDIGNTVLTALYRYEKTGVSDPWAAGNGSLMRLAPVPLYFAPDPEEAIRLSGESSRTTHGTEACVDACRYFGGLVVGAVRGASKEELLSERYSPSGGRWASGSLCDDIDAIARGSFRGKEPPDIAGSGHVVRSLEAAFWAFDKAEDFREGCLLAANLGDDADTTAAIYGQVAGARYGIDGIPDRWRSLVARGDLITRLADGLLRGAERSGRGAGREKTGSAGRGAASAWRRRLGRLRGSRIIETGRVPQA